MKSSGSIGGNEPSSTTMTRSPRRQLTNRRTPGTLSRTGITTVTSRCDGPPAGRGWATVASSRVRASWALTSSRTFSRPSASMLWAAGANFSRRVGEPPSSAEPSPSTRTRRSTWTANPSGSRVWVMSASRRARATTGRLDGHTRRPSRRRCACPRQRSRWSGPPTPRPCSTAATPPRRIEGSNSGNGSRLPVSHRSVSTSVGEICSNTDVSVCAGVGVGAGSHARAPSDVPALGAQRANRTAQRADIAAMTVDEDQALGPAGG